MMKMQEDRRTGVLIAFPAATVASTSAITAMNCKSYQSAYYSRIAKAYLLAFMVGDGRFFVSEKVASVLLC